MAGRLARCLGPVLLGAFLTAGCHKATSDATVPPATPPAAAAPDTNQQQTFTHAYTPPQPNQQTPPDTEAPPVVKANGEVNLHQLDNSIMHWVFAHQRAPNSFAEFAQSADVTVPPPPAGKKYAFGPHYHVILVDAKQSP